MTEKYCEDCEYFRGSGAGNHCDLEETENPHPSPDDGACVSFFPRDEDDAEESASDMADLLCELVDSIEKDYKRIRGTMDNLVATHYYIKDSVPKGSGAMAYTIQARDWKDGKVTAWALMRGPFRFNKKEMQFKHEPLNSSKTPEFIADCSFSTLDDAYDAYVAYRKAHPERF